MDFNKVIYSRHSVREFENKPIPKDLIKKLVVNASKAPSACNRQPWYFYVVQKRKRDKIVSFLNEFVQKRGNSKLTKSQAVLSNFYKNAGAAPVILLIYRQITDSNNITRYYDLLSIGGAVENLILSATNEGLGSCWCGSLKEKEKELSKLVNAHRNQEYIGAIILGYPKKGFKYWRREKRKLNEIWKMI